jgi:LPXTG-motif cell wall-anchored protein
VKISSGSTIADISSAAMEKLSVGDHTITFVYMDGEASAAFSVAARPDTPSTGDPSNPALLAVMLILSLMGIIGLSVIKKRGMNK